MFEAILKDLNHASYMTMFRLTNIPLLIIISHGGLQDQKISRSAERNGYSSVSVMVTAQ